MTRTRGSRRVWSALAVGVAGLTLSGCGALHPGVAAVVGEETITVEEVDAIAEDFCAAVEPQLEQEAESIPHGYFRGGIVGTLAMRSIAEQVAEQYGVTADSRDYTQQVRDIRRGVGSLDEDIRESIIEVETAPLYVEEIQAEVGRAVLDREADREQLVAAGADAFDRWVADHEVEFDPSYNTVMKDGVVSNQDQGLSHPVSETARGGLEEQPNSVLARMTPTTHRCGR